MKKIIILLSFFLTVFIFPQSFQDEVVVSDTRDANYRIIQLFDELSYSFRTGNTGILSTLCKNDEIKSEFQKTSIIDGTENSISIQRTDTLYKYLKYKILNTELINDSLSIADAKITLYNDNKETSFDLSFYVRTDDKSNYFLENEFLNTLSIITKHNKNDIDAITDLDRINCIGSA